jgi:hypothetical protein
LCEPLGYKVLVSAEGRRRRDRRHPSAASRSASTARGAEGEGSLRTRSRRLGIVGSAGRESTCLQRPGAIQDPSSVILTGTDQ